VNDVDVEAGQTGACSCGIDIAASTVRPLRHRPLPSPCTDSCRGAPTCHDRLIDYRSSFPAMKARKVAATTMAAPCGRTEPRFLEARVGIG
jgi:hypothetical protein